MPKFARIAGIVRLKSLRRGGGDPTHPIAPEEEDLTPPWGIEEGEPPQVEPPDIEDPPGVWPPLEGPDFPIFPVPPEGEEKPWEPGEVWPPIRPPGGGWQDRVPGSPGQPLPKKLFFACCRIPEYGWRWVVVDLNAIHRPEEGWKPRPEPQPPEREPKRILPQG
jgi:hypothetical protein